MAFKLIISDPKTGKSVQREVPESRPFIGKKIGESFKGELIDLTGYEFKITGGSESSGFPMRDDITGQMKKKIFAVSGVGIKPGEKGIKQRKTVTGNTISERTAQVNVVVVNAGKENLFAKEAAPEATKDAESAPAPKEVKAEKESPAESKPADKNAAGAEEKTE